MSTARFTLVPFVLNCLSYWLTLHDQSNKLTPTQAPDHFGEKAMVPRPVASAFQPQAGAIRHSLTWTGYIRATLPPRYGAMTTRNLAGPRMFSLGKKFV